MPRQKYDCSKCPGYCCSYPVIEVKDRDAERIAKHFGVTLAAAEKRYFKSAHGYKRVLRRKVDEHFGRICRFFDSEKRCCSIYMARPSICRTFPGEGHCGYYDFLTFERETQEDPDFISTTDHSGN